jgi:asparagine synthase (glutamine-hydrolysing)
VGERPIKLVSESPSEGWLLSPTDYGRRMGLRSRLRQLARNTRNRLTGYGLSDLSREVLDEGLTYLAPAKRRRIEKALAEAQDIPGDFVEFGVALGGSAILISRHANGRQFHGFDVFGMIPEPTSEKDDTKSKKRYQVIRSGASAGIAGEVYYGYRDDLLIEVKRNFERHGLEVNNDGVHLHQGLFEESWPKAEVGAIALVHIDCDWYDPVAFFLNAVAPKLSPGGMIIIDDFHDYGGCRTAVEEFLDRNRAYSFHDGANPILRLDS